MASHAEEMYTRRFFLLLGGSFDKIQTLFNRTVGTLREAGLYASMRTNVTRDESVENMYCKCNMWKRPVEDWSLLV
jgi:hypothetical protein